MAPASSLPRWTLLACAAVLGTALVGPPPASATPLVLPPGAVTINQIDYRDVPNSLVGELTIDRTLAISGGFVNVIDTASNSWLVRNLPIFDALSPYNSTTITARMDLSFTGLAEGTSITSPVELIIDFNTDPSETQGDVSSHGTAPDFYPVGDVANSLGGGGPGSTVRDAGAPPLVSFLQFLANTPFATLTYQQNHPNVQAGCNQCAPAAVANSFQFLENTQPLVIPHPHNPGFGNDGTLVGQIDLKTGRALGANRRSCGSLKCFGGTNDAVDCTAQSECPGGSCGSECVGGANDGNPCSVASACPGGACDVTTSDGVWPLDGKLSYLVMNGLGANVRVKHQGDQSSSETCAGGANTNAVCNTNSQCPGGTCSSNPLDGRFNRTYMGMTSYGAGAAVDINWIESELEHGEDVELDLHYQQCNAGSRHCSVTTTTACSTCSAGANVGAPCILNSECPGGTCANNACPAGEVCTYFGGFHCNASTRTPCMRACAGGPNDRVPCSVASQCPSGACTPDGQCPAGERCVGGRTSCINAGQCPNGERCVAGSGRHYVEVVGTGSVLGVPFLLHASDKDQADTDRKCAGGANDGKLCRVASECPGGACTKDVRGTGDVDFEWITSSRVCVGGANANALCAAASVCPGGTCESLCSGGANYRAQCTVDSQCPGGVCGTTFAVNSGAIIDQVLSESRIESDPVRHYGCYEVEGTPVTITNVTVSDVFGSRTVNLTRAKRLCNPASKNGEDPDAADDPDHLLGYLLKQTGPRFTQRRGVTLTNQFGTFTVDVRKPDMLYVPTAKSLAGPPSPLGDLTVDHLTCYKIKGARFTVSGVALDDQFGSFTLRLHKPLRLCAPSAKVTTTRDEGILNPENFQLCFKAKPAVAFRGPANPVSVDNQFEATAYEVNHMRELCVPSKLQR